MVRMGQTRSGLIEGRVDRGYRCDDCGAGAGAGAEGEECVVMRFNGAPRQAPPAGQSRFADGSVAWPQVGALRLQRPARNSPG